MNAKARMPAVIRAMGVPFIPLGGSIKSMCSRTPAKMMRAASARESESKKGMDDSQVSGTASSYARKYALNGLFCIDDTKDADTDEYKRSTAKDERAEDYAPVTPPPAEPTKFVCNHCGKVLAPYKDRNGKDISIRQHAAGSEKKFGQVLCLDCIQQFYPDSVRKDDADATE